MNYELLNKDMKKIRKNDYRVIDFTGVSLLNMKKKEESKQLFKKKKKGSFLQAICEQYVRVLMLTLCTLFVFAATANASVRIKDIAYFDGVRDNQLIGYGLVVGLNGTGDKSQSAFTVKSIASLLSRLGVQVDASQITPKNVAAVMVTADLPPFIKPGARMDVTLSSLGDASTLEGGTLLLTPLQGADGQVYAAAQGQVSVGGFEAGSRSGAFGTVARVPQGALIEREVPVTLMSDEQVSLLLEKIDFTTCVRVAEAINVKFGSKIAEARDGALVSIRVPEVFADNPIRFLSKVERIEVQPDMEAKIIINERTGTIVGGEKVKISRVSLSHKGINIEIKPEEKEVAEKKNANTGDDVSSFAPASEALFNEGGSEAAHDQEVEEITVGELAQTLSSMGVKPVDMIAILQAIKKAGAIQGDFELI